MSTTIVGDYQRSSKQAERPAMDMIMRTRRISLRIFTTCLATSCVLACLAQNTGVFTAEPKTIVRVEEDWELTVGTPDSNSIAPQATCAISPASPGSSPLATFELNHNSQPSFVAGGLQLQVWDEGWPLTHHSSPSDEVLGTDGEVIRWTQTMVLSEGSLRFEIVDGTSATWGSFGGKGHLRCTVQSNLENLNGYDPETSVKNSGIAYASHRVQTLTLKRIRLTSSTGEVQEDNTPRVVHEKN